MTLYYLYCVVICYVGLYSDVRILNRPNYLHERQAVYLSMYIITSTTMGYIRLYGGDWGVYCLIRDKTRESEP